MIHDRAVAAGPSTGPSLRSLASSTMVIVPGTMVTQTCESCGREFGCGADDGACWCNDKALSPERLAILREHFERCLCPDCLDVAARVPGRQ